jgi:hypothetical protein
MTAMVDSGTLRPLLAESRLGFAQIAAAHRYLE